MIKVSLEFTELLPTLYEIESLCYTEFMDLLSNFNSKSYELSIDDKEEYLILTCKNWFIYELLSSYFIVLKRFI